MIEFTPTVGRVVHYFPPEDCKGPETLEAYAAIVTQVNEKVTPLAPGSIDLVTFGPNSVYFQHKVPHSHEPKPGHWSWPPRV